MQGDRKGYLEAAVGRPAALAAMLTGFLAALIMALPAYAVLTPGGGVSADRDARTGFPRWYEDGSVPDDSTPGIRVKLCVDNALCLGGDPRPNRSKPASLTVDANPRKAGLQPNMPDEAFYAVSRAETVIDDGGRIRWRAVLEGAFSSASPRPNRQITFTRTQVTGDNLDPDAHPQGLRFLTPYGNLEGDVLADGTLDRVRNESPPGTPANDFAPPVTVPTAPVPDYGPTFMRWDAGARPGFLGNPLQPHTAVGGPENVDPATGLNFFAVQDIASGDELTRTRLFEIAGQCVQDTC